MDSMSRALICLQITQVRILQCAFSIVTTKVTFKHFIAQNQFLWVIHQNTMELLYNKQIGTRKVLSFIQGCPIIGM